MKIKKTNLAKELKEATKRRKVTLNMVAKATKISLGTLTRIKEGHDCRFSTGMTLMNWMRA